MRIRNCTLGLLLTLAATLAFAATPPAPAPPASTPAAPSTAAATSTPTTHQNQISCIASGDSTATNPGTTTAYRLVGACPATVSLALFSKAQSGLSTTCNYTDTAVVPGQVTSYVFTAVIGGKESVPSDCLALTTPTFSPSTPTGTAY
jgi:hypothetical protein